jgi:hypothetical protein
VPKLSQRELDSALDLPEDDFDDDEWHPSVCITRCIVCLTQFYFAGPECREPKIQPYGGLICSATGGFGSGLFDPPQIEEQMKLVFLVCDDCLKERRENVLLFVTKDGKQTMNRVSELLDANGEWQDP